MSDDIGALLDSLNESIAALEARLAGRVPRRVAVHVDSRGVVGRLVVDRAGTLSFWGDYGPSSLACSSSLVRVVCAARLADLLREVEATRAVDEADALAACDMVYAATASVEEETT